jgi:hypothetical protein
MSAFVVLAYTSTLKMEAVHSFEMLAKFYQTIRRYTPEDSAVLRYEHRKIPQISIICELAIMKSSMEISH